ncbi:MAG TPA: tripartite tricarboxylate transporter substrate binding protein [Xanthobacteraceae bacterium]|nr:tripartite tricarboxylate transporter substrate binding protein [Xanthobacteraceae bacterium]
MKFTVYVGVLIAIFVLLLSPSAPAQDYPTRPIRVIATSSAGGTSDIFMRALADELHKGLGQPFIVENRPGGSFNIGARACAEAPPDGYTLCIIPGEPLVFNQFLYKTLGFDPENGFEPVTQLFFIAQALVVSGTLNVKTLPELVALSKAKPGTLSYSTASVPLGVFIERLKKDSGADLVRVPFRGGGEAVTALLNGSTPVGFYGISNVRAQLESGAVVGLLVDSEQRSPLFPNIPTLAESGQKKLPRSYFGLLAPAKTPKPIIARLQAEVARIAAEPGFRNRNFVERGLEPVASTPDEFARYIKEDRVVAEQVVKEAGLQPQ